MLILMRTLSDAGKIVAVKLRNASGPCMEPDDHLHVIQLMHAALICIGSMVTAIVRPKLSCIKCRDGSVDHDEGGHLPSVLGHLSALQDLALIRCLDEIPAQAGTSQIHLAAHINQILAVSQVLCALS